MYSAINLICLCPLSVFTLQFTLDSKLLYEMYKSVEQEVEEMDERDSLPRVGSVLKILIGKVC